MKSPSDICPICGREKISPECDRCPQCDADLTCFRVLDSLPEQLPAAQPEPPSSYPAHRVLAGGCRRGDILAVGGLIALVLALLLGPLCFRFGDFATRMEEQGRALVATLHGLNLTLDKLAAERPTAGMPGKGEDTVPPPPSKPEAKPEAKPLPVAEAPQTVLPPGALPAVASPAEPASTAPLSAVVAKGAVTAESTPVVAPRSEEPAPAQPPKPIEAKAPPASRQPAATAGRPAKRVPGHGVFLVYRATDRDTLWSIAAQAYGSGHYYPVILWHNPGLRVDRIWGGLKIRLLKDPAQAKAIYAQIVKPGGKR